MKLNYSLNSGFTSGDGATPSRDNVASWIAWLPARATELSADFSSGDSAPLYLVPRSIPDLADDTVLLGIPVGELSGNAAAGIDAVDPQQLSYAQGATANIEAGAPISLDAVRVVAARDGAGRRQAQAAFAGVSGERQFHVMPELFEG